MRARPRPRLCACVPLPQCASSRPRKSAARTKRCCLALPAPARPPGRCTRPAWLASPVPRPRPPARVRACARRPHLQQQLDPLDRGHRRLGDGGGDASGQEVLGEGDGLFRHGGTAGGAADAEWSGGPESRRMGTAGSALPPPDRKDGVTSAQPLRRRRPAPRPRAPGPLAAPRAPATPLPSAAPPRAAGSLAAPRPAAPRAKPIGCAAVAPPLPARRAPGHFGSLAPPMRCAGRGGVVPWPP